MEEAFADVDLEGTKIPSADQRERVQLVAVVDGHPRCQDAVGDLEAGGDHRALLAAECRADGDPVGVLEVEAEVFGDVVVDRRRGGARVDDRHRLDGFTVGSRDPNQLALADDVVAVVAVASRREQEAPEHEREGGDGDDRAREGG